MKLKRLTISILIFSLFLVSTGVPPTLARVELTPDQEVYFDTLYKETWASIQAMIDPVTGLPFDSTAKQPATSLTNVGLYLAALTIAYKTGLIPQEDALKQAQLTVDSLDRIPKWRGFPRPWFRVKDLEPTFGDEFSYGSHIANLIGGLTLAKSVFPELEGKIEAMLYAMTFKDLYDEQNGWLKGGFNIKQNNFAVFQPWGRWYYKFFASETRLLSFYAIARGAIPPTHWKRLVRNWWQKEGFKVYQSGYEEGGLFTQYMTGLFLDEHEMEMGDAQRNYALSQMKHAEKIGAPAWGWSSSSTPKGRYLGYGELKDDIIAPYASVLAAVYFPEEVYKNLRALEELGARQPYVSDGKEMAWGFRDAINWRTKELSPNILTLDQCMIFLSLANLLHDGIVWNTFQADAHVQKGLLKIKPVEEARLAPAVPPAPAAV